MVLHDVLIVDGSAVVTTVVTRACAERGMQSRCVDNVGDALVDLIRAKPAAIIASMDLRGMPGTSLLSAVHASPSHRAIPFAMITSRSDGAMSLPQAGADRILSKDADLAGAVTRFLASMGLGRDPSDPRGPTDAGDSLSSRILLAEDATSLQMLFSRLLHVAGADVTVVGDGLEAVGAFGGGRFDLVVLDLEMPNMDGKEAARRIRLADAAVPIIALTGHDADEVRDDLQRVGFNDVIQKSAEVRQLAGLLRPFLRAA